ncbi:hypothetical protein HID58_092843 [Brassica napus]|uniref:Uncharacterized protein n=1 Tax=Brassica napus TaxID=3708 RepID=A0ABQ7XFR1_BRANA|nr:hypothetical protein HID58_092843 [Brassica napus]
MIQKIEITFIVSQNLIAMIPFHHLSPNLVQLRETMAKSKSKKKGNLNSQPSSSQIDNREGNVTASMSKLRCGEDDMTASRSELQCGDDAATNWSCLYCGKEDDKLSWCEG